MRTLKESPDFLFNAVRVVVTKSRRGRGKGVPSTYSCTYGDLFRIFWVFLFLSFFSRVYISYLNLNISIKYQMKCACSLKNSNGRNYTSENDSDHKSKTVFHVILAGWLGSTHRALDKYADLYRKMKFCRCIVHPVIAPPMSVVEASLVEDDLSHMKNLAVSLVDRVSSWMEGGEGEGCFEEVSQAEKLVIFHSFSNGGCFLLEQFRNLMYSTGNSPCGKNIRIVGTIFDSSPAFYSNNDVFYGGQLSRAMQYTSWFDRMRIRLYLSGRAWRKRKMGVKFEEEVRERARTYWRRMLEHGAPCTSSPNDPEPELYLYSNVDSLCPIKPLESLIRHRSNEVKHQRRRHVMKVLFDKSPHCCHIRTQPHIYELSVKNFLEFCGLLKKIDQLNFRSFIRGDNGSPLLLSHL